MKDKNSFDVIIIGGSYAGLSAAMALGRSLRTVLVIDSGLPCNKQTPHSHNFITQDGETPSAITEKAKAQVLHYHTVLFHNGIAVSGTKTHSGFEITTQQGEIFQAKKLIFASGIKDIMPDIKGFADCWGISVIHCPYCHGYEFRNQKTGIFINGEKAFHIASLVNNLTDDITLLTSEKDSFTPEQLEKLHKHNITINEKQITEIEHKNGYITHVVFEDGSKESFTAIYAALPFEQQSDIPKSLGCEHTDSGYIQTDTLQRTTIPGVFACGDNSNPMRAVAQAVFTGNMAGAVVNKELVDDVF
jgi:thioredoxin reductase